MGMSGWSIEGVQNTGARCRAALPGMLEREVRFVTDSPLEEAISSEPVSEYQNSLLAGN